MNTKSASDEQEASIEALLREVGPRDLPPAAVQDAVRAAVHAEWRGMVDERVRRRRITATSLAAGVGAVAVGVVALLLRAPLEAPMQVATIVKIERSSPTAHVQIKDAGQSAWRDLEEGAVIQTDSVLRTDGATRVALAMGGLSLRVDGATVVQLASDRAQLDQGRVYVDSGSPSNAPATRHFTVDTPFGAVSHLGTQYQVQLADAELTVSVREGRVAIAAERAIARAITVASNEQVRLSKAGAVTRRAIAANDPLWQWTMQVAPGFDIEDRTFAAFAEWVARETGRQLEFASDELRAQAEQMVLHGSTAGMTPEQALRAVAATTEFAVNVDDDSIIVR